MKNILLACFLFFSWLNVNSQSSPINIIPQPVKWEIKNGNFEFKKNATISYSQKELEETASLLAERLRPATGFAIASTEGSKGTIQLELLTNQNIEIGTEGYLLNVTSRRIKIQANTKGGIFNGIQSLVQLFPVAIESKTIQHTAWKLPCIEVVDYPRFAWRGFMLDCSRHFFTKDEVKAHIDQLSHYKLNVFHWHLTDDEGWRIEIKSLPKLTEVGAWRVERQGKWGERQLPKPNENATYGGFYTQEDIKEVVRYAQQRNITIVPEVDVPGHSMAAVTSYPEISCTQSTNTFVNPGAKFSEWYGNGTFKILYDNTLNPASEKAYDFLDKVFTEVAALFPGAYIHVGGDECYKGIWAQDSSCQALMTKLSLKKIEELQGYFIKRVESIITAKGKKLIGWDEIMEGSELAANTAVMSWRGTKSGIEASQQKHPVVMAPTAFSYIDYNQGDKAVDPAVYASLRISHCYSFDPTPEGADPNYILGAQANLWTEQIPTTRAIQYMSFPRVWALSEVYWTPQKQRSWEQFVPRMYSHFLRADAAEINYSTAIYDAIVKTSFQNGMLSMSLSTEVPDLTIHYTLDNTMPTRYSPVYKDTVTIPEAPVIVRVVTYKNNQPIGHLITLTYDELKKRAPKQ